MNSSLVFEYEFSKDGDDFGWLKAKLDTPLFTARNGMWVQRQDVVDFAKTLKTYPIQADCPAVGDWGFGEQGKSVEITKLSISHVGLTGGLVTRVVLANYYDPTSKCSTNFKTDYPSLMRFSEEIQQMMLQRTEKATLCGSGEVT